MNGPGKLNVRGLIVLDGKDMVLACEQGLFHHPYAPLSSSTSSTTKPNPIAGVSGKILQIVHVPQIDMILLIAGENGEMWMVNKGELMRSVSRRATSNKNGVNPVQCVPSLQNAHLLYPFTLGSQSYCAVAASGSQLAILKFNARIQSFKMFKELNLMEPIICMELAGNVLIVATDRFLTIDPVGNGGQTEFLSPNVSLKYDYPSSLTILNQNPRQMEFFVSYQNYAIFVNSNGQRTRKETVEWVRSPLQIVYTQPFLYVVHFESIEVFRVQDWLSYETPGLEAVSLIDLKSPHFVGRGDKDSDLFFLSSKSDIEAQLNLFNPFNKTDSGSSLKRRALDSIPNNLKMSK